MAPILGATAFFFVYYNMVKLGVIGSRSFHDYELVKKTLEPYKNKIQVIISGGAQGADKLAEKYSWEVLNKKPLIFKADWYNLNVEPCDIRQDRNGRSYNHLAGYNRNTYIVENSDAIIAFWDEKSNGTKDSIWKARRLKKPIKIINFKN